MIPSGPAAFSRGFVIALLASVVSCAGESGQEPAAPESTAPESTAPESNPPEGQAEGVATDEGPSVTRHLLLWLPNRICDLLDVVRARVRLGPGWTLSVRATELVDLNLGAHASVFAGLPGPRGAPRIPWPVGLETFAGVEVSVLDGTTEQDAHAPRYGLAEFGVGFHLLILGVDLGVDPFELADAIAGILLFDPLDDDFGRTRP